ncbi:response regulator transcription factor [Pseudoflavitalea sp. G-6-1-2]|uniref:LytR/AlgR family response regulator transcription factor n=1 Tax=Pseudoflavitalea sp. G-6-1-2 TaxID=2728841 RepID=UPI00146A8762|nr:LytTR family DNA-binding domain-containing protein [Pseudoflavitalea sp. G-6-1-2]NML23253.1 response regulator transcription factor [Pseudoflavitalea sp. G-6-1-2]
MKIQCLLIDDEPYAVSLLEEYIGQVPYLQLQHKCYNALEALEWLKGNRPDLIFLDINMPHLSGMQLAGLLPPNQLFIFTTAYSEFAAESYEKNAVDYLVKPITFDRFLKSVIKVSNLLSVNEEKCQQPAIAPQKLFLKTGRAIVQLEYHDVLMVEGLKDYVVFHTSSGKHIVYKRMKELEESLPANFSRIHLSYIVNRNHIRRIEDNHIHIGQERVPVGDKYREQFLQRISKDLL